MINSIDIKNHETHLDTYFELHSGVNVFVGESDEGKSGIIRALTLNTQNRPMGDSYRNDKLDPKNKEDKLKLVEVKVDYKNSAIVTRARDGFPGGVNHYQIDDGEPLRALRGEVPDEVQEVTLMKDVNIQGQHPSEQYFLLADNPGQVAKKFNKVSGLTVMDKATADINSQVRDCNSQINIAKKEIEEKEAELEELEWVPKAEKLANKLMNFKSQIDDKKEELDKINSMVCQIKDIDHMIDTYFYGIDEALGALNSLKNENQKLSELVAEYNGLENFVFDLKAIDLKIADTLHTDKALKSLKSMEKLSLEITKEQKFLSTLNTLVLELEEVEGGLLITEDYYKKALKIYNNLRETTECPTCGRIGK